MDFENEQEFFKENFVFIYSTYRFGRRDVFLS